MMTNLVHYSNSCKDQIMLFLWGHSQQSHSSLLLPEFSFFKPPFHHSLESHIQDRYKYRLPGKLFFFFWSQDAKNQTLYHLLSPSFVECPFGNLWWVFSFWPKFSGIEEVLRWENEGLRWHGYGGRDGVWDEQKGFGDAEEVHKLWHFEKRFGALWYPWWFILQLQGPCRFPPL